MDSSDVAPPPAPGLARFQKVSLKVLASVRMVAAGKRRRARYTARRPLDLTAVDLSGANPMPTQQARREGAAQAAASVALNGVREAELSADSAGFQQHRPLIQLRASVVAGGADPFASQQARREGAAEPAKSVAQDGAAMPRVRRASYRANRPALSLAGVDLGGANPMPSQQARREGGAQPAQSVALNGLCESKLAAATEDAEGSFTAYRPLIQLRVAPGDGANPFASQQARREGAAQPAKSVAQDGACETKLTADSAGFQQHRPLIQLRASVVAGGADPFASQQARREGAAEPAKSVAQDGAAMPRVRRASYRANRPALSLAGVDLGGANPMPSQQARREGGAQPAQSVALNGLCESKLAAATEDAEGSFTAYRPLIQLRVAPGDGANPFASQQARREGAAQPAKSVAQDGACETKLTADSAGFQQHRPLIQLRVSVVAGGADAMPSRPTPPKVQAVPQGGVSEAAPAVTFFGQ